MIVQGLAEVIAGLIEEAALADSRASDAVRKAAEATADDARQLAPVRTGALRSSIEATISGTRAEVGPTASYAPFVEFGTYKDAPQPFMGPAISKHEEDLATELAKTVGEF